MGQYSVAQICLNGHVITSDISFSDFMEKFCSHCGAYTITKCPHCNASIRGDYHEEFLINTFAYKAPAYCFNCGHPFPWTVAAISAATELVDEIEGLDDSEREKFKSGITDITNDNPHAKVSANRITNYLKKATPAVQEAFKTIMYDVAAEVTKRLIWPI